MENKSLDINTQKPKTKFIDKIFAWWDKQKKINEMIAALVLVIGGATTMYHKYFANEKPIEKPAIEKHADMTEEKVVETQKPEKTSAAEATKTNVNAKTLVPTKKVGTTKSNAATSVKPASPTNIPSQEQKQVAEKTANTAPSNFQTSTNTQPPTNDSNIGDM